MQNILLWATYVTLALAGALTDTQSTTYPRAVQRNQVGSADDPVIIEVGSANGTALKFFPDQFDKSFDVGTIFEFRFHPKNHTVTESSFADPCNPLADSAKTPTRPGVSTGFVPVQANQTFTRTFRIQLNDTKPMWLYCGQKPHCAKGMAMVINQNRTSTDKTLDAYKAAAAKLVDTGASQSSSAATSATVVTPVTSSSAPPAAGASSSSSSTFSATVPLITVSSGDAPANKPAQFAAAGGLALVGALALL